MLSEFSRDQSELPRQPNLGKITKIALISVVYKISRIFHVNNTLIRVSKLKYAMWIFKGAKEVAIATKFGQNKPKLHWFRLRTRYQEFFGMNNRVIGSANSNMLSEFSGEQGRLPWQPNLGKISQNCTDFGCVQDIKNFLAWITGL